ncbi:MAG TPA: acyclic terpene utilization AtuA family protein [Candidatus Binatia bacterium]|nr:acyclic terpene utilization AtuA family protein [Candidatus Binatia bacterium]
MSKLIKVGCGAGFWGDSPEAPRQLVESGQIDYLVLDYLAEITMSLLARARAKDAKLGYATDLPEVIAALAPQLAARKIKVVTNAGGVNPAACKAAIEAKLSAQDVALKVAIVTGDDLLPQLERLREVREMFTGEGFPARAWSANAYLGAFPIAAALGAGADIVITGRCVDSALALGPLVHEFGWRADQHDLLAAGSLAGHVIECGAQATGGISTDWRAVAEGWHDMGFPIAECRADGSFVVGKPAGTGGRVTPETVAEQIVYEIGDPGAYLLPDVSCDFRDVALKQIAPDRVEVTGARGSPPPATYKASVTWQDGFRSTATMMIGGVEAPAKARAVGEAILKRCRRLLAERALPDFRRTDIEVLGAEANWGASARVQTREVILKLAVHHDSAAALEIFGKEFIPSATSMSQGITGFSGGRPSPVPLVRLFSCLVPKDWVAVEVDGRVLEVSAVPAAATKKASLTRQTSAVAPLPGGEGTKTVPLIALAYGRSGDKGNAANIGVLARKPEFVPILREQLTADAVKQHFAHFAPALVERFEWPGLHGFNFLLHEVLGGGGVASLRYDPQGKMLAQVLMDFPLRVPAGIAT